MSKMGSFGAGSIKSFGFNAKSFANITPNFLSIYEGSSVTFSIELPGISETVYWTNSGSTTSSDFSDNLNSGSITITNGKGTLTRTAISDGSSEGVETIIIEIRKGSVSGTILCTSNTVIVNDYPYAVVPVAASSGNYLYSQYKFVNLNTFSVDYTVTASAMTGLSGIATYTTKVLRFGNFLMECSIVNNSFGGKYWIRNIITNTAVSNGNIGALGGNFDIIKINNDKFGILYKSGLNYYLNTYLFNFSTGAFTFIATIDFGALSETTGTISGPRGTCSVTLDNNFNVVSYNGIIAFSGALTDYGYYSGWGRVRISPDGKSASLIGFDTALVNYSRPASGLGGNGTIFSFVFDNAVYRAIDSNGQFLSGSNIPGPPSAYNNCSSPVLGTNNSMIGQHIGVTSNLELKLLTKAGYSTSTTVTTLLYDNVRTAGSAAVLGPYTLQPIANGCICIYNDASNAVKYITYNSTTNTWSSPGTITGLTSNVTINACHAMTEALIF